MAEKHRCEETVWGGRVNSWHCQNWAVVQRDNKRYCKIHDPEYIAEKRRKWQENFDKERAERYKQWHRAKIIRQLLEGFDTAILENNRTKIREFISTIKD